jgi:hypothetical protein
MAKKIGVVITIAAIVLIMLISGCTQPKTVKDLSPDEVANQFWVDIGQGNYDHAYDLAYHANQNISKQVWVDEHISKWGDKGSYIKIYSFNVTDRYTIDSSQFEGNFTEAEVVSTNATIAYMGQNETGQLNMILVNTTDGWKVFGNY